jgi:uncharacterized alpha-E superfamily protein
MLSRIADSLFWIARYMERAEDTARTLDVNYHMLLEQSAKTDPAALGSAGSDCRRARAFSEISQRGDGAECFRVPGVSSENPNSIVQCIGTYGRMPVTIRDRISRRCGKTSTGLYLQ